MITYDQTVTTVAPVAYAERKPLMNMHVYNVGYLVQSYIVSIKVSFNLKLQQNPVGWRGGVGLDIIV